MPGRSGGAIRSARCPLRSQGATARESAAGALEQEGQRRVQRRPVEAAGPRRGRRVSSVERGHPRTGVMPPQGARAQPDHHTPVLHRVRRASSSRSQAASLSSLIELGGANGHPVRRGADPHRHLVLRAARAGCDRCSGDRGGREIDAGPIPHPAGLDSARIGGSQPGSVRTDLGASESPAVRRIMCCCQRPCYSRRFGHLRTESHAQSTADRVG